MIVVSRITKQQTRKKVVTVVTIADQLLSHQQDGMVTTQDEVVTMVTIADGKGVGLHLDSAAAHFRHKNRGKCLKRRSGQGRNRTADASLFRAALYQLSYLAVIPLEHH
jgi:hypothetical protein